MIPKGNIDPWRLRLLTQRTDLLASECEIVEERRLNWRGRLRDMGDYGKTGGGSSGDRRIIVETMAMIEAIA